MFIPGLLVLTAAAKVAAHMELTIESKYDPLNTNPDYSMTSPLNADGSNFPCKGYLQKADAHVTASLVAGQMTNFTLTGSATHGGGSCQISLSYDQGKTFKVIESVLGGCPLQSVYNYQVPSGLPAGQNVVLSWSWMNKVGNREFYQNCALVDIAGSGTQSYLASLPNMQVANVGNGCASVEGIEVIPETPGSNVQYGGSYAAGASSVNGNFGAGLTGTCGTASSNAISAGNVAPVLTSSTTSAATIATPAKVSSSTLVTTRSVFLTTSAPGAITTTTSISTTCSTEGAIICTGNGFTWSICSNGKPVAMGSVAPGTICKNGVIGFDTTTSSSTGATTQIMPGNIATTSVAAVVKRPTITTQQVVVLSTSTTSKASATTTQACLGKREYVRSECSEYAIKCGKTPKQYRLCSGGTWSSDRPLLGQESCLEGSITGQLGRGQSIFKEQVGTDHSRTRCFGTGITCTNKGTTFIMCDSETEVEVPVGTKCLEGALGGGLVSWHSTL